MVKKINKIKHTLFILFSFAICLNTFAAEKKEVPPKIDGFTLNYDNVAILEYIQFVSKICDVNFIYNSEDLQFNITVVSKEPITKENVMSALLQILRIHGLSFIEENNSFIIHKSEDVKELASIATDQNGVKDPIVTRLFSIKNVSVGNLAAIIQPMISTSAMLEVSAETRQLIITDVISNINKIEELITNIDSFDNPLQIEVYKVKSHAPSTLIRLTYEILAALLEGNPLILVPQDSTRSIFIVSTPGLVKQSIAILTSLDIPPETALKTLENENLLIYKLKYRSIDDVISSLGSIATNLKESGYPESGFTDSMDTLLVIPDTNSLLFVGPKEDLLKIGEILENLDTPVDKTKLSAPSTYYLYALKNISGEIIEQDLDKLAENLENEQASDPKLLFVIQNAKWIKETNSILLTGDASSINEAKNIIESYDVQRKKPAQSAYYLYKLQNISGSIIEQDLTKLADQLKQKDVTDPKLLDVIENAKWIQATNSILLTGDPDSIDDVKKLIQSYDSPRKKPPQSSYSLYKLQNISGDIVEQDLEKFADQLKAKDYTDPNLLDVIENAKWIKESNSILLTGDPTAIDEATQLIKSYDHPREKPPQTGYYLYKLQNVSGDFIEKDLDDLVNQLKSQDYSNPNLLYVLENAKWVKETNSILLTGDPDALDEAKGIIKSYDHSRKETASSSYYIYKLQNASGDIVENDLDQLATKLRSQNYADPKLLYVIENAKWIKETNSILLTGNASATNEAKEIIKSYDHTRKTALTGNQFFMYSPKFVTIDNLESSLIDTANNLKNAGLVDSDFLNSINNMKTVKSTNSIVFTGSPATLEKIQTILPTIDTAASQQAIQQIGKTNFLLYKIQHSKPQQLISSIKAIVADLSKTEGTNQEFIKALKSMKYVAETNSLLFTGTQPALEKIKSLVDKFDISTDKAQGPLSYYVYKPLHLSGTELEHILSDFAEQIKIAGLTDQNLFETINSMKYSDKTNSLVFTGDTQSIEEIKALLTTFDVTKTGDSDYVAGLNGLEELGFLVYKLQYHSGEEIHSALKQISSDLSKSSQDQPIKSKLVKAINSIQWLKITNTLICTGDEETINKLKELIKNLDIPLKQVFIEVLVIDTTLSNLLNFGLDWGSKFQYKDKMIAGVSNNANPTNSSGTTTASAFSTAFDSINATKKPSSSDIGVGSGFDLGIIGDILLHKGKSFLSLGSLLNALQTDIDTTIVMTPKLITQDGKTSKIFMGSNVPYVGSTTSNSSNSITTTTNLEYRDVGMSLTITPILGNSDVVTLSIDLSATEQQGSGTSLGTVVGITTLKTSMNTSVHIPNKHFLVLSGMARDEKNNSKQGIPCLGGLPFIGAAFSQNNTNNSKRNIVIFLRPHIINSFKDMENLTENQEDFFREQAGTPLLEKHFDEAIELIKSYED